MIQEPQRLWTFLIVSLDRKETVESSYAPTRGSNRQTEGLVSCVKTITFLRSGFDQSLFFYWSRNSFYYMIQTQAVSHVSVLLITVTLNTPCVHVSNLTSTKNQAHMS